MEEEDLVEVLLDHADTKLSPESLQCPCARFVIVDGHREEKPNSIILEDHSTPQFGVRYKIVARRPRFGRRQRGVQVSSTGRRQ